MKKLNPNDIIVETWRSKTRPQWLPVFDSSVRIKHIQTGIEVTCDKYDFAHLNKRMCEKMLLEKLNSIKTKEGDCETCGKWDSSLVQGMCSSCRKKYL